MKIARFDLVVPDYSIGLLLATKHDLKGIKPSLGRFTHLLVVMNGIEHGSK